MTIWWVDKKMKEAIISFHCTLSLCMILPKVSVSHTVFIMMTLISKYSRFFLNSGPIGHLYLDKHLNFKIPQQIQKLSPTTNIFLFDFPISLKDAITQLVVWEVRACEMMCGALIPNISWFNQWHIFTCHSPCISKQGWSLLTLCYNCRSISDFPLTPWSCCQVGTQ